MEYNNIKLYVHVRFLIMSKPWSCS